MCEGQHRSQNGFPPPGGVKKGRISGKKRAIDPDQKGVTAQWALPMRHGVSEAFIHTGETP